MLAAGEQMSGPYRWERYDVLVMPRSFPYGGMENPRLTFISPSIVAGDRSLVSTVVHELAHSWSGNLVTNATWNDFWLNEGVTSYLERRLVEGIYGERLAHMEDAIAYGDLVQAIEDAKAAGHPEDTYLKFNLAGRDPNESSSDVSYEKGRWFLGFLEGRFGRPAFDAFLREYFDAHAFQSIDTEGFRAWLLSRLERPGAPKISVAEIDEWLYGQGLPATMPAVPQGVFDAVDRAAADWRAGKIATADLPVKDWVPQEWVRFLDKQPADLEDAKLADLRSSFPSRRRRQCGDRTQLARARHPHGVRACIPGSRAVPAGNGPLAARRDALHRPCADRIRTRTRAAHLRQGETGLPREHSGRSRAKAVSRRRLTCRAQ